MCKLLSGLGAIALAVFALAACGSSSSSTTSTTTATIPAVTVDASIASQVPAAVKSKGTLNVGTEAQYAPERVRRLATVTRSSAWTPTW